MNGPLAVVIPTRNEAAHLPALLADLARAPQLLAELIVVDGGSVDGTPVLAARAGARVVHAPPSRGGQLVAGIQASSAPWLWLLHADLRLPGHWPDRLAAVLTSVPRQPARLPPRRAWYGELRVECRGLQYRLLERAVALRSALGQRPYGDQGLLIERSTLTACGGLKPLAIMEDLEFAERFAGQGRFHSLGLTVVADGRRWQRLGLLRTTLSNAALRRAWRRGQSMETLTRQYDR